MRITSDENTMRLCMEDDNPNVFQTKRCVNIYTSTDNRSATTNLIRTLSQGEILHVKKYSEYKLYAFLSQPLRGWIKFKNNRNKTTAMLKKK